MKEEETANSAKALLVFVLDILRASVDLQLYIYYTPSDKPGFIQKNNEDIIFFLFFIIHIFKIQSTVKIQL